MHATKWPIHFEWYPFSQLYPLISINFQRYRHLFVCVYVCKWYSWWFGLMMPAAASGVSPSSLIAARLRFSYTGTFIIWTINKCDGQRGDLKVMGKKIKEMEVPQNYNLLLLHCWFSVLVRIIMPFFVCVNAPWVKITIWCLGYHHWVLLIMMEEITLLGAF